MNCLIMDQNQKVIETQPANVSEGESLCPSNELGYLIDVRSLIVQQQRDLRETLRGTEEPNVYFIYDKFTNEKLYTVQESVSCLKQQCCGGRRGFILTITDKFNRQLIKLERKSACLANCCCFLGLFTCLEKVTVSVRNYRSLKFNWNQVGSVKQTWNPLFPLFNVCDDQGNKLYEIHGPAMTCGCCCNNVHFQIVDSTTCRQVGNISKKWSGICTECTSDTDRFKLTFFDDAIIDEKMKAVFIGGLFLIDFKYYEN